MRLFPLIESGCVDWRAELASFWDSIRKNSKSDLTGIIMALV